MKARGLAALVAAFFGLLPLGAVAQSSELNCNRPGIETCPSLYEQECRDADFRLSSPEIGLQCVEIFAGATTDAPSCLEYDAEACAPILDCDPNHINPVKAFNCQSGVPSCPDSTPQLAARFDEVLNELSAALVPYEGVIEFDPGQVGSIEALCKDFTPEEFENLREQSTGENRQLGRFTSNLTFLGQCADFVRRLVEGGTPNEGISDALWADARVTIETSLEGIQVRRQSLSEKITDLGEARAKVEPMYGLYQGFCAI